jgi:hypothetical protein
MSKYFKTKHTSKQLMAQGRNQKKSESILDIKKPELCNVTKTLLRMKFVSLNFFINKEERSQINNFSLLFEKIEQEK